MLEGNVSKLLLLVKGSIADAHTHVVTAGAFLMQGNNFINISTSKALPKMLGVYVQDNQLSGGITEELFSKFLPNIQDLFLGGNNFIGPLPNIPL